MHTSQRRLMTGSAAAWLHVNSFLWFFNSLFFLPSWYGGYLLYFISVSICFLSTCNFFLFITSSSLLYPHTTHCVSAVTGVWWGGRPADLNVLISPRVQPNSWTQHQSTVCYSRRCSSRSLSFFEITHFFCLTGYSGTWGINKVVCIANIRLSHRQVLRKKMNSYNYK